MIIDERIVQLLVPGTLPALYPMIAPDGTAPPYTTYLLMNNQNLTTHSSPLPQTRMWSLQLSTYSSDYGETRTISNAIQDVLVGYTDDFVFGITPIREHGSIDSDFSKLYCWAVELLVIESLP